MAHKLSKNFAVQSCNSCVSVMKVYLLEVIQNWWVKLSIPSKKVIIM